MSDDNDKIISFMDRLKANSDAGEEKVEDEDGSQYRDYTFYLLNGTEIPAFGYLAVTPNLHIVMIGSGVIELSVPNSSILYVAADDEFVG